MFASAATVGSLLESPFFRVSKGKARACSMAWLAIPLADWRWRAKAASEKARFAVYASATSDTTMTPIATNSSTKVKPDSSPWIRT